MASELGDIDESLVEALEEFEVFHRHVYQRTVAQWLEGWGPAKPFEKNARVVLRKGREAGLGFSHSHYDKTGEFLFLPDESRDEKIHPNGHIKSFRIIRWEDIESVGSLTEEDVAIISRAKQVRDELDALAEASRKTSRAEADFRNMVEKARPVDSENLFRQLADGNPEKAAAIVAALKAAAVRALEEQPSRKLEPSGTKLLV